VSYNFQFHQSIAAQRGDLRVAMVTGQYRQQPSAKSVPLMGYVAAAVAQGATVYPRLVHPGGGKKLGEKDQLRIRSRAGFIIPADMKPSPGVSTVNESNSEP
jgi:hypothetical protein